MLTLRACFAAGLVLVAAAIADAADSVAPFDLDIGRSGMPAVIDAATTVDVEVEVVNRGTVPWTADGNFALAYHWLAPDGDVVVWDGVRTAFDAPLAPGESRLVTAVVRTPDRGGEYRFLWDVVQEDVRWLSEVDPTPIEATEVTVRASHAFSFIEVDTPRLMVAGTEHSARVVVRNDGARSWPADGSVSVAVHWWSRSGGLEVWEGRRNPVTRAVAPGDAIELEATVRAPEAAGVHRLQWDMVDEGTAWFSERDASVEPEVVVVVLPAFAVGRLLWFAAVVIVAGVLVRRARRTDSGVCPVADVAWAVAAVIVKQLWVVRDAGLDLTASGWWLTLASAALIGYLLIKLPPGARPWACWSTVAAVTALMAADVLYQRFFGDLVSVASIGAAGQISTVAPSVRSLIRVGDLWLWADLAPALVVVWVVSRAAIRTTAAVRRAGVLLAAATLLAGVIGGIALSGQAEALRQVFRTTEQARRIGVLNFHAVDLVSSAIGSLASPRLDADHVAEVERYFAERRALRSANGPLAGAAAGDNLIMIQVESLQGFVIGLEVGGQEVTPFLNGFAAQSLWFTNVTDQTEEGRSSDAELATQVSLLPPDRGAAAFRYDRNDFTGLASILSSRGWDTVSAVPFDGSFWNRRVMHRRFGFNDSLFAEDFPSGEIVGWGLNDRDFLTDAAADLVARNEPWCGYLLTLSLHHPFAGFPDRHKEIDVGRWRGTPFGNFVHTMRFFDHAFEALVRELDRAGVLDRTVIAVWGDHDAGFEWRPEIADIMGVDDDSTGWYLSQEVPLIIRVPGLSSEAGPRSVVAGHVDVAPTLLALLGVDPAPYAFVGRNLLGSPGTGPVIGEYRCWRDADHVFLRHGPELADGECLDVATLDQVEVEACRTAFEAARLQVEMSELVLKHDLQRRIHDRLSSSP